MFSDFPIPHGTEEPDTAIKSFVRSLLVCVSSIKKKPTTTTKQKFKKPNRLTHGLFRKEIDIPGRKTSSI